MDFDFSWELELFKKMGSWWRRLKKPTKFQASNGQTSAFNNWERRLVWFARTLCEENVTLQIGKNLGGLSGNLFILPSQMAFSNHFPDNDAAWLHRVRFMAELRRKQYYLSGGESKGMIIWKTVQAIQDILAVWRQNTPEAYHELQRLILIEYEHRAPYLAEHNLVLSTLVPWAANISLPDLPVPCDEPLTYSEMCRWFHVEPAGMDSFTSYLFGLLLPDAKPLAASEHVDGEPDAHNASIEEEVEAPAVDNVQYAEFSKKDQQDAVLLHTFEKVECLDDYNGLARDFDGANDLKDHQDALSELDMRQIIRTNERTDSIYRANLRLDPHVGDAKDEQISGGIPYPEWNEAKNSYRLEWCRVFTTTAPIAGDSLARKIQLKHRGDIKRLHDLLAPAQMKRGPLKRQLDGEEIDLDSAVNYMVSCKTHHTPSERIYIKQIPKERDVAALILLDLSLSVEGYVEGRPVLEVLLESLVVLGSALEKLGDRVEVAGFNSKTRHSCQYILLKAFNEHWDCLFKRIDGVQADGYTRIGPILRHGIRQFHPFKSKLRLMTVFTDGKPNDYDRYEGTYGLKDVRKAVAEVKRKGIHLHALAIGTDSAHQFLPEMFKSEGYTIINHPSQLPHALGKVYCNLKKT